MRSASVCIACALAVGCGRVGYSLTAGDASEGDASTGDASSGDASSLCSFSESWQVSSNDRDAWDDLNFGSIDQCPIGDVSFRDAAGFQWQVTIPRGASIVDAALLLNNKVHSGAAGSYEISLHVEDVDNAAPFTGAIDDIHGRSYWATTVGDTVPAGGWPEDVHTRSPDISVLVQHIIDRPGWSAGNYLSIAAWGETDVGGANEDIYDFGSDPSNAAKLEVTYEIGCP